MIQEFHNKKLVPVSACKMQRRVALFVDQVDLRAVAYKQTNGGGMALGGADVQWGLAVVILIERKLATLSAVNKVEVCIVCDLPTKKETTIETLTLTRTQTLQRGLTIAILVKRKSNTF